MFLRYTIIFILITGKSFLTGQNLNGVAFSNYAGVNQAMINPASLANNLIAFSFEPFMVNVDIDQNLFKTKGNIFNVMNIKNPVSKLNTFRTNLLSFLSNRSRTSAYTYDSIKNEFFSSLNFNGNRDAYFHTEFRLPSFMFSIGKKTGVAITSNIVSMVNLMDNYNGNLLANLDDIAQQDSLESEILHREYNIGDLKIAAHQYIQIGVHVGTEIFRINNHQLKAGIGIKRVIGLFANSLVTENLAFQFEKPFSNRSRVALSGKAEFYSFLFTDALNNSPRQSQNPVSYFTDAFFGRNNRPSGWGIDFGLEYEIKNKNRQNKYDDEWNNLVEDYSKKDYILKISFSVLDLGAVNYRSNPGKKDIKRYLFSTLSASKKYYQLDSLIFNSDDKSKLLSTENFKALGLTYSDSPQTHFRMVLPTRIMAFADYHLYKNFYVSGGFLLNVVRKKIHSTRFSSYFTLVPRYESRNFDFGLPITYTPATKNLKIGLGMRLGPFIFGSDNLLLLFSNFSGVNFYTGFRFALNKHKPVRFIKSNRKKYAPLGSGIYYRNPKVEAKKRKKKVYPNSDDITQQRKNILKFKDAKKRNKKVYPNSDDITQQRKNILKFMDANKWKVSLSSDKKKQQRKNTSKFGFDNTNKKVYPNSDNGGIVTLKKKQDYVLPISEED